MGAATAGIRRDSKAFGTGIEIHSKFPRFDVASSGRVPNATGNARKRTIWQRGPHAKTCAFERCGKEARRSQGATPGP